MTFRAGDSAYSMTTLSGSEKSPQKLGNLSMVERKRIQGMSWLQAGTATNTLQGASASGEMLHQQISREGTAIDEGERKLLLP